MSASNKYINGLNKSQHKGFIAETSQRLLRGGAQGGKEDYFTKDNYL